jgi:exopolysaccharide production protein ExoY
MRVSVGKRIFDILFSIGAICFFLPLGIIVIFLILICSPGPIFYSSQRIGKNGQNIRCWKFRTMCRNADEKLQAILEISPALREEWHAFYKLKKDPRITCIGQFLRKTSLDELPQFLNVLSGELSVVGPRPVTQEEVIKYYKNKAKKILSIKPGLTGLWQTSGRNELAFDQRIRFEESYVDLQSLTLDLKIIFKTIKQMVFSLIGY